MKTITIVLALFTSIPVLQAEPRDFIGDAKLREAAPSWKDAKPKRTVILNIGDELLLSTNIYPDPFDGPMTIRTDGTITPKYCKKSVKIAGLSEAQASIFVLDHACSQGVYDPESIARISVVLAERFEFKEANKPEEVTPDQPSE